METDNKQHYSDCIRVVLFGPESTGKSTLSKELAAHYRTAYVPEFARDYLQEKWDAEKKVCDLDDLNIIAKEQLKLENKTAALNHPVIFCDTNALVTQIWSETHFDNYCHPEILQLAKETQYDLYFLTYVDVPWEKDDLRDSPNNREKDFLYFKNKLEEKGIPYVILKGTLEERMQLAIHHIYKKMSKKGY